MNPYNDNDLAPSILLYMAAVLGVFALIVVPVYFASKGSAQKNSGITTFAQDKARAFPLDRLKSSTIVDPALASQFNDEAKRARASATAREMRRASRTAPSTDGSSIPAVMDRPRSGGGPSSADYNPATR
jgi:hypothetical protein